jgi:hypothetical protein
MAHYNLQIWENGKSKGLLEVKDFHLSINLGVRRTSFCLGNPESVNFSALSEKLIDIRFPAEVISVSPYPGFLDQSFQFQNTVSRKPVFS